MATRPYGLEPTAMRTKDGLTIYDFDQFFSTVLALAGPGAIMRVTLTLMIYPKVSSGLT